MMQQIETKPRMRKFEHDSKGLLVFSSPFLQAFFSQLLKLPT